MIYRLKKKSAQRTINSLKALLPLPSVSEIAFFLCTKESNIQSFSTYQLTAFSAAIVTLTLLFLYFFRIALHKVNSCDTQLLQVRLRLNLCEFIESYAEYSSAIKEKNPDALSKFEALIFSGIVGSDDKLPSTFDGLEQLTALTKSIRGKA